MHHRYDNERGGTKNKQTLYLAKNVEAFVQHMLNVDPEQKPTTKCILQRVQGLGKVARKTKTNKIIENFQTSVGDD